MTRALLSRLPRSRAAGATRGAKTAKQEGGVRVNRDIYLASSPPRRRRRRRVQMYVRNTRADAHTYPRMHTHGRSAAAANTAAAA